MIELNKIYNEDCLEGMQRIESGSVDCILTDPPYLYLKNQKLDRPFDEVAFFNECNRVLKKDGMIAVFGRGTSFYRWNTMLAGLGFKFKEEIVWNKSYSTSPLMPLSRVHETISIHAKGKGKINKVKVPYLEMKGHDIGAIVKDIKKLKTTFKNTKSLDAVLKYLENNERDTSDSWAANDLSISSDITIEDRCVSVARSINGGMNEKSVIRTDYKKTDRFTKYAATTDCESAGSGDGCVIVVNSIVQGMNEKSIIKEIRDHFSAIHPTQKPVRLLERLMALVSKQGDTILDPFSGSGATMIAAWNTGRNFIGFEIDKEYFDKANERIKNLDKRLFA